jgi:hypothetical protein
MEVDVVLHQIDVRARIVIAYATVVGENVVLKYVLSVL